MKKTSLQMLTGNPVKFAIAERIFNQSGLLLSQLDLDIPEIQSLDVMEVAIYSAKQAALLKQEPVFKTDVGFYIPALGGFPGALIKYATQALSSQDWLNLMSDKFDKSLIVRECLCCAWPDGRTEYFVDELSGRFTDVAVGQGFSIDQVIILDGWSDTIASYTDQEQLDRWIQNQTIYSRLAQTITSQMEQI